jgi:hypothetical protein
LQNIKFSGKKTKKTTLEIIVIFKSRHYIIKKKHMQIITEELFFIFIERMSNHFVLFLKSQIYAYTLYEI